MQFRWFAAFVVFLGSYLPLTVILMVQDIRKPLWSAALCNPFPGRSTCSMALLAHPWVALGMVAVSLASMVLSGLVLGRLPHRYTVEVLETKKVSNDLINYVFPYVVSFMGLSYGDPDKMAGFAVFVVWMFAITYRAGQISMNPLLLLFGFQLYEARLKVSGQERNARLLSRTVPLRGNVRVELIQDFYFMESPSEERL